MKRWLALLILLGSCNGCMLFDDPFYDQPPVPTQTNSCGLPPVNIQQTAEPPR